MNLGENIYRLRTEKNMSQGDLADALEVSRQSVSKWENNSAVPELEKLIKMCDLFGISLDALVGKEVPQKPQPTVQYVTDTRSMPGHRIAGIILLVCAAVVFLGFAIAGDIVSGLLLAIPLMLNGLVCMLCKKHAGFVCCWLDYILFWLFNFVLMVFSVAGGIAVIPMLLSVVLLVFLVAWTLYKIYRGRFNMSRTRKIVCTVLLALLLIGQCALIFVSTGNPNLVQVDEYTEVYPSIEADN